MRAETLMATTIVKRTMTMKRLIWCALIGLLLSPAAARAQTEEVVFYHTDAVGSVRMITGPTGNVIARYDFTPFGETWDPQPNSDRLQFGGKEFDAETKLNYFGARYFRPESGRFLSVDPKLGAEVALMDPQRWNRYSYVGNRPTRLVDPDGRGWLGVLFKVGKAAYKGQDIYSSVSSVVEDTSTIFSMDARVGTSDRLWATGGLLVELSGAGDVVSGAKGIASFAMRHGDDAAKLTRRNFRKNLGGVSDGVEEGAHAHHMLPQAKQFSANFQRAGLNIHDPRYGSWWEAQNHLQNAKGYNERWELFFSQTPNASSDQVLEFGRQLASEYGLKIYF